MLSTNIRLAMTDAILTNRRAQLSSLGTRLNDLYYSEMNSTTSMVEATFNQQNVISLTNNSFNGSANIFLPIDQFLGAVILHLRLPNVAASNQSLCRGWGYNVISRLGWTLGASSSSQIQMDGSAILQAALAQCKTAEKRSELLRLGGEEQLSPAPGVDYLDAYVFLPLPFSSLCGHLPLDSTLLSNNIQLYIQFRSPATIYGGTAARPTSFLAAELLLRQGKLTNQASSIKDAMQADPSLVYSYPFVHNQSYTPPDFVGSTNPTNPCQMALSTFLNADLLGIAIGVVKVSDIAPTADSTPNPFNYVDLGDIEVTFNGTTLFRYPGKSYKLANMTVGTQSAQYFHGSVVAPGSTTPFASSPVDNYQVMLDFSFLRAACLHDHLANVWRIQNQQLQIRFTTPESGVSYRLFATYFYNAVAEMQNGTSAVYVG